MKYQFYAIIFDVAGNTTPVGSSTSPAKSFVTNIQKVTGISISPSGSITKNIGESFTISATVSPSDANNKSVNWNSTNTNVAKVDGNGKVTCLSAGITTITATSADGSGVSASLSLTVRNPINSLTLDKDQTTILKDGYTSTVTATTDPANYDGANITWTIADTSIATVTVSGKTATIKSTSKIGQTTLTVSAGNITKTVNVSVVNFVTTTYSYTGSVQQVDLPAGTYKFECWGAQGGNSELSAQGGKGGYSVGTITLNNNVIAYICIGGQGLTGISGTAGTLGNNGGWNGGGSGGRGINGHEKCGGGGGGGTDIRINENSLYSRLIVAGAGSGGSAEGGASSSTAQHQGQVGGGTSGGSGGTGYYGGGGTQNCGGIAYTSLGGSSSVAREAIGAFGIGANGASASGGAGGGWYGGGGGSWYASGGGSGYVYTSSTASNYPSGCRLNSSYYLTNAQTVAGNQSFPNVAGTGNETGHSGNGAAKITPVN